MDQPRQLASVGSGLWTWTLEDPVQSLDSVHARGPFSVFLSLTHTYTDTHRHTHTHTHTPLTHATHHYHKCTHITYNLKHTQIWNSCEMYLVEMCWSADRVRSKVRHLSLFRSPQQVCEKVPPE